MPLDRALFDRHDELVREAQALLGVDTLLADTTSNLRETRRQLAELNAELALSSKRITHHKAKIERCQNHALLKHTLLQPSTWLNGGVSERIKRQQEKLADTRAQESQLSSSKTTLSGRMSSLESQQKDLEAATKRKRQAEAERQQLIDAIAAGHPTSRLTALVEQHADYQRAAKSEERLAIKMKEVAAEIDKGRSAYRQAAARLNDANSTNTGAQFNNFLGGDNFGFELVEHVQQHQRDSLIHDAAHMVQQGAFHIQHAARSVPAAVAQRYPQETLQLSSTHLPTIEQTGLGEGLLEVFGGDFGDAIAGLTISRKINRSLHAVQKCLHIVEAQQAVAWALIHALENSVTQVTASKQKVAAELTQEKQRIFETARANAGAINSNADKAAVATSAAVAIADPASPMASAAPIAVAVPIENTSAPITVAMPVVQATRIG